MIRGRVARGVAGIAAATLGVGLLLIPTSASAGVLTAITFETAGPVNVGFGDDWYLRLSVTTSYEEGPTLRLQPSHGTVDVYFSGIGGAFVTGLPIQPDGLVYVSQPLAKPLLPAGEYEVSAIFNPTPGGYFDTSQTATPLKFTVAALAVTPSVEVVNDVAVSERPVITAALGGEYVEKTGGAPAGTWHFIVTDTDDQPVYETNIAQKQGATEPLRVEVDSELEQGVTYTVTSAFTPVDELVGGLTVGDLPDSTFTTPSGTFGEAITAPVPMPLWVALALLAVFLGLGAAAIVILVKLRGRAAVAAPDAAQRIPGDPQNVEVVSLGELGLPDPETIPELLPEGQTEKLPASTTWLLSDVEPATSAPESSEAPTERLNTVTASELPTELIESTDQVADAPPAEESDKS
jgi:hypothetical protein